MMIERLQRHDYLTRLLGGTPPELQSLNTMEMRSNLVMTVKMGLYGMSHGVGDELERVGESGGCAMEDSTWGLEFLSRYQSL